jgi:hypothetical protein
MRPSKEALQNENQYTLVSSFSTDDTLNFLLNKKKENTDDKKPKSNIGMMLLMILSGVFGFFTVKHFGNTMGNKIHMLYALVALFLIVLPIHEFIHGLTFKALGAPKVGYGISWKGGMIYAYAQEFPISMQELKKVAIMPFLVITSVLAILLFVLPAFKSGVVLIQIFHTLACIGDFLLVKYAIKAAHKNHYTYDDILHERKTYFYNKKK